MVCASLAAVLSASPAPSLAAEDASERLNAVQTWVKKQKKPQLSSKDARAITECIELPAVKETGCEQKAKLCRLQEGDDGSSGTRVESLSLLMLGEEHAAQPLLVWWSATYEAKVSDCEPPEHLLGHETAEQRVEAISQWKKKNVKEFTRCIERLEKKVKADAEELMCDLMLVNACRREAYVTCKTRNLRKGNRALEPLHRFEF